MKNKRAVQILNYLGYLESTLTRIAAHTYDENLYASMYAPKIIKRYNDSKVLITKFQELEYHHLRQDKVQLGQWLLHLAA